MTTEIPAAVRRKALFAAIIGNFIEWFDFGLYGYFATAIAGHFFSTGDDSGALIKTFAAFGVSFLLRPLGALVFGHFGDRIGRRGTLSVAVLGTSVATFIIGALPGVETIGIAAPILLLVARVVQGFCAGGEFGGATAFMVEYAPANRRVLFGSWQMSTQWIATLVSTAIGAILAATLGAASLADWGWRLPFLITLPLGLVGLYLRLRLDETPQFKQISHASAPLMVVLREHWRPVLKIMGLIITGTTTTYTVQSFLPSFLAEHVGMPQSKVFIATMIGAAVLVGLIVAWSLLADRIGRHKPFLVATPLALAVLAVPVYLLLLQANFLAAVFAYILIAIALAPMYAAFATAVADAFPTRIRYSGLSIAYSVSVSIFGGFTPLVLTSLVEASGMLLMPAIYLAATGIVSFIAAVLLPETGTRTRAEPELVSSRS